MIIFGTLLFPIIKYMMEYLWPADKVEIGVINTVADSHRSSAQQRHNRLQPCIVLRHVCHQTTEVCAYWSTSAYMGLHQATCRTPSARSRVRNHASPAIRVIGWSHRAGDATYNNGRLCLRRRSTARLEQSARRNPSQPISGCLQTFTENLLLYPVLLLTLFLLL